MVYSYWYTAFNAKCIDNSDKLAGSAQFANNNLSSKIFTLICHYVPQFLMVKSDLLKTIQISIQFFFLIKSSKMDFIFLPSFFLIILLMTLLNNV